MKGKGLMIFPDFGVWTGGVCPHLPSCELTGDLSKRKLWRSFLGESALLLDRPGLGSCRRVEGTW